MVILSRRKLFGFMALAAPAIVAAPSLMRVSTAALQQHELIYAGRGVYQRVAEFPA